MGLGWFLIPTLAGYWFLTHLYLKRYNLLRESGYHVFFQAALAGGVLVVLARAIVLSLNYCFPQVNEIWKPYALFPYSGTAALSIILGFVLPLIGNRIFTKEESARKTARDSGDLIELLIAESIEKSELIEVSLRTGKSYIGFALESGMTRRGEADIALIPVASGYRNKDTQKLEITNHYAPVIQDFLDRENSSQPDLVHEDFQIVLPISEIVSVRIFFFEVYESFNPS